MPCRRRSSGTIVISEWDEPRRHIPVEHRAHEDRVGRFWLICRDCKGTECQYFLVAFVLLGSGCQRTFVSSLVHSRKGQVPILSDLATDADSWDQNRRIARFVEMLGACIVDGQRYGLAPNPVAQKVAVAVNECYFDAAI